MNGVDMLVALIALVAVCNLLDRFNEWMQSDKEEEPARQPGSGFFSTVKSGRRGVC